MILTYSMKNPRTYCQTEISRSAKKKKSSKSGGAKKAIGVLCKEQFETTDLCFLGAGGHVKISGIRNLWAFGVEQPLEGSTSTVPSKSMSVIFGKSLMELVVEELGGDKLLDASWFLECTIFFLKWLLLLVFLVGLAFVWPEGAIWIRMRKASDLLYSVVGIDRSGESIISVYWIRPARRQNLLL